MNRLIILPILFLVAVSWAPAEEAAKPKEKVPTAIVLPEQCVFTFPIDDLSREWKWGVSPASQCEYSWMVTVKNGDKSYQIGFSYFNPFGKPRTGTFKDLLVNGQANVWELSGDGASYVEGVDVTCDTVGDGLRIAVSDEKWIKKQFAGKPKTLSFETTGSLLKQGKTEVKVAYKKASETVQR